MAIGPDKSVIRLIPSLQRSPRYIDHGHADLDLEANSHSGATYSLTDGTIRAQIAEIVTALNTISGGSGTLDHTLLLNIGTNTHVQLDSHVSDSSIHFTEASIDHGNILGLADDDHTQYHNNTRGDARYFQQSEFLATSAGAGDFGKPVKLDADGNIDTTMINDGDIDHININSIGTNTHAQIDTHIGDGTLHFTASSIDHGSLDATSLTHDDHSGYLWGLGRSGGQTLYGGSDAGDGLTLTGNPIDGGETTVGGNRLIAPAGLVSSPGVDVGGTGDGIFHDGFLKIVSGGATSLTIQDAKILCHDELEMQDNQQLQQGNAGDWRQTWSTTQTPDTAIMGLSASSMSLVVDVVGEWTKDHALPAQTYPTFAFFGGQDPTIYPNRYLTIGYNGANQRGVITTASGTLQLTPATYVHIGTTGTPGYANNDGDLYVYQELEVDGRAFLDGGSTFGSTLVLPLGTVGAPSLTFTGHTTDGLFHDGADIHIVKNGVSRIEFKDARTWVHANLLMVDNEPIEFGSGADSSLEWQTANNVVNTLVWGLDIISRHIIICEKDDANTNWNRAADTNPTLYIQSADAATIADWISFSHDQTDGVIATGIGGLNLVPEGDRVDIGQAANDEAVLSLWSGGSGSFQFQGNAINHGMTGIASTTCSFRMEEAAGGAGRGGVRLWGLGADDNSDNGTFQIWAITTETTVSDDSPLTAFYSGIKSGTSYTDLPDDRIAHRVANVSGAYLQDICGDGTVVFDQRRWYEWLSEHDTETTFAEAGITGIVLTALTQSATGAPNETDGNYAQFTTSSIIANCGLSTNACVVHNYAPIIFRTKIKTDPSAVTSTRIYIGLFESAVSFATLMGSSPGSGLTSIEGYGFFLDTSANGTSWYAWKGDGVGDFAQVNTGITIAADTAYVFEMRVAGTWTSYFINNVLVARIDDEFVPGGATDLAMRTGLRNLTTAERRILISYGRLSMN